MWTSTKAGQSAYMSAYLRPGKLAVQVHATNDSNAHHQQCSKEKTDCCGCGDTTCTSLQN